MFLTRKSRFAVLLPLTMLLLLAVAACAPASPVPAPAGGEQPQPQEAAPQKKTVVLAQGVDATFLDPHPDLSGTQVNILHQIFDPLVFFNRDAELVPRLAESWDIPDPTTYIFHIRKGVKFHDGHELTAQDVKFSFERCYMHTETMVDVGLCLWDAYLDEVNVLDDYTVEVKLKQADAPFLSRVTRLYIVSEDAVRSMGPEAFNEKPPGTGPFKVKEWVRDERVVLEANQDYWDGAPEIDELIIRPIPEASTRMAALRSGEVDMIVNVPPDNIPILQEAEGVHVKLADADRLIFIYLNTFEPPFDDVTVRHAVNYAVDWDAIIENVLNGQGYRTPCPITPFDFPYNALENLCQEKAYEYDPEKAKDLLAEAGYPDGFELTLEGPDGRYLQDKEVLEAVGGYLDQVGIETTVKPQEWGIYYQERFYAQKVTAGLFGMGNPLYDIDHLMGVHFDPARRSLYYNTPRLTELINMGINTPYPEEREQIYREAMTIIMDDAPWIFGYGMMHVYGIRDRIEWEPWDGFELIWFKEVSVKD